MFIVFALLLIMGACFAVRWIDNENDQLRQYAHDLERENDLLRTQIVSRPQSDHDRLDDFLKPAPFNLRDIRKVS